MALRQEGLRIIRGLISTYASSSPQHMNFYHHMYVKAIIIKDKSLMWCWGEFVFKLRVAALFFNAVYCCRLVEPLYRQRIKCSIMGRQNEHMSLAFSQSWNDKSPTAWAVKEAGVWCRDAGITLTDIRWSVIIGFHNLIVHLRTIICVTHINKCTSLNSTLITQFPPKAKQDDWL